MYKANPEDLHSIAIELMRLTTQLAPWIEEGKVMTVGPVPYRRLDCDGRALAYIRERPRKRAVRVDISGLWITPRASPLGVPNAGGTLTLMVKSHRDLAEAATYLLETVERTRETYRQAAQRERRSLCG